MKKFLITMSTVATALFAQAYPSSEAEKTTINASITFDVVDKNFPGVHNAIENPPISAENKVTEPLSSYSYYITTKQNLATEVNYVRTGQLDVQSLYGSAQGMAHSLWYSTSSHDPYAGIPPGASVRFAEVLSHLSSKDSAASATQVSAGTPTVTGVSLANYSDTYSRFEYTGDQVASATFDRTFFYADKSHGGTPEWVSKNIKASDIVLVAVWNEWTPENPTLQTGVLVVENTSGSFDNLTFVATQDSKGVETPDGTMPTYSTKREDWSTKTSSQWWDVCNIPEPTSGLLLLLGVAGLALRRKQRA